MGYDVRRMAKAYVECAAWADRPEGVEHADDLRVGLALMRRAERLCRDFVKLASPADLARWTPEQAGHDFWLSRQGHGAGFWDRGEGATGDRLHAVAKTFGTAYTDVRGGWFQIDE